MKSITSNSRKSGMRFLVLVALLIAAEVQAADESKFARVELPLGVSIEVPKNWWLLGGDYNKTIEAGGEAVTKLAGLLLPTGKKVNLFRANSNPPTTYAGIAINATDSEFKPSQIQKSSDKEIANMGTELRASIEKGFAVQGLKLVSFSAVRKEIVDGHPALSFEYTRTGPNGNVVVKMTRLFIGAKEISLNLSYRESEESIWKPVVAYMRSTFKVGK